VTVPGAVAQEIVDRLVAAGVKSILSFAPTTLSHPDDVDVRHVDLATELQVLAYFAR
jgi:redox-sensing transcriptional repressor